ncbi:MAG: polyprenyl synthetase family protein [Muribaculaceae bacterium]|nr:polyprenyl synthetase family protein [Muribaculaceae bacterium]
MLSYNDYLAIVNQAIASIAYPSTPSRLYDPIAYTMSLGGKRLRPVLTLMSCAAMGGNVEDALPAAVGLELFHNFTLLHDDVMDRADVRRGQPTVHRRWNDNVAILSGDAMLTLATQHIARVGNRHRSPAIDLFNRTAMEIYEGQQYDMDFECRDDVSVDEYIEMIRLKTSVLLGCACRMGGLVADAPEGACTALYEMGVNLGLAFQLQDDALDVWGDPATFGKAIGGDIMNNKKTYLLIHAMHLAQGDDAQELRRWLTDTTVPRDSKVAAVTALYERLGLRQLSDQAIARYNQFALEALGRTHMSDEARQAFASLINQLTSRQS